MWYCQETFFKTDRHAYGMLMQGKELPSDPRPMGGGTG
jgi:hypothetical protein